MTTFNISGIQQIGIGTTDMRQAWKWYADVFGTNIRVLEDDTVAERMLPYTGNKPQKRHAAIAINLQGGGGFEIWQYSERTPKPIDFEIQVADLGTFCAKLRCKDVAAYHAQISMKHDKVGGLTTTPDGIPCFYIEDPFGNYFQVIQDTEVYINQNRLTGGMIGALVGVTDIDRSLAVYRDILGYDTIVYDKTGVFDDLAYMRGGGQRYRRVLLAHSQPRVGAYANLLGKSTIELLVALDRTPRKIYEGRYWGDPGFIQICYDVNNMKALEKFCTEKGFPFTVDSCPDDEHFDMGDASGHFTYIEDPDGNLIEFVETERIPIIKKLGWYIDFNKRDALKPLPKILFRAMGMVAKVKF
ncbi:MAG: VOC family protein [Paludibacteraceae bacterium]|nr:VOC family protein [Paludibacteraceae bacterium]